MRVCFLIDELAPAGTESQLLALIAPPRPHPRSAVPVPAPRGKARCRGRWNRTTAPFGGSASARCAGPRRCFRRCALSGFYRRERIDVVQAYFPDSSYFGLPAAWLAGVPHRLRTRNNLGHWLTPLHRRLGRLLNRVATGRWSTAARPRTPSWPPRDQRSKTVTVLENGVDHERFLAVPPLSARIGRHDRRGGQFAAG